MNRVDLCEAIKLHKVYFFLNPDNEWANFPDHLKALVRQPWTEFKYFVDDTNTLNPEAASIPNDCGGIYLFYINAKVIPDVHVYLAYIGRARKTDNQNLRKRVREYATEEKRLKICNMKHYWGKYLYVRYLPLPMVSNDVIDELETELIKAVLPPFNDQFPKVYNQAIRSAF